MNQLSMDFTPAPAPYQRHSRTSAAAASIEPKTGTKRALVTARLIKDSGQERNTSGGDAAVVWVAVEHGGDAE